MFSDLYERLCPSQSALNARYSNMTVGKEEEKLTLGRRLRIVPMGVYALSSGSSFGFSSGSSSGAGLGGVDGRA